VSIHDAAVAPSISTDLDQADSFGPRPAPSSVIRSLSPERGGGDMDIETLNGPIEPQSAIMKGN
jgi:hypothetical protein